MAFTSTPVRVNNPTTPDFDLFAEILTGDLRYHEAARVVEYGGNLFAFLIYTPSGAYNRWVVWKSTDNGATWAQAAESDSFGGFDTDTGARPIFEIDGKVYCLVTVEQPAATTWTVRAYRYNLATETWTAGYSSIISRASSVGLLHCAIARGTDILVFHFRTTLTTGTAFTVFDSTTDTVSLSNTSISATAQAETAALDIVNNRVHVFLYDAVTTPPSFDVDFQHVSINADNSQNTLAQLNLAPAYDLYQTILPATDELGRPAAVYDGYVYWLMRARPLTVAGEPTNWYSDLFVIRGAVAADPTFTLEVVRAGSGQEHNDFAVNPALIVQGSSLYAVYKNSLNENPAAGEFADRLMYARRTASGWTSVDTLIYSYSENPPPADNAIYRTITSYSLVPNTGSSIGFTPLLTLGQYIGFSAWSVFWLLDSPCCCADFAY